MYIFRIGRWRDGILGRLMFLPNPYCFYYLIIIIIRGRRIEYSVLKVLFPMLDCSFLPLKSGKS